MVTSFTSSRCKLKEVMTDASFPFLLALTILAAKSRAQRDKGAESYR
jgi:hypothetical protein